jgi:hypothetical protein
LGLRNEAVADQICLNFQSIRDPLRGDPRFEKIVEEAKQPMALK